MIYYGVYCIYLYLGVIFYFFIDTLLDKSIITKIDLSLYFNKNTGNLAAICSIAFTIHIAFMSIIR